MSKRPKDPDNPEDGTSSHEGTPPQVPRELYRSLHGLGALRGHRQVANCTLETVLESGLFEPPSSMGAWPLVDPEYLFHFHGRRHIGVHTFFRDMLGSPETVAQHPMWHLFWALTEGTQQFVSRYIRFWSHEERLTGHLITEVIRSAEGGTERFDASPLRGRVSLYYADIAARSMERKTGADFALIIQIATPGGGESFKVALFQAKKVGPNGKARVDINQLKVLRETEGLGYYAFYYAPDSRGRLLPPTVVAASAIGLPSDENQKTVSWAARSQVCDFATFVVFALADLGSEAGVFAGTASEAAEIALSGGRQLRKLDRPSRALVLSIGVTSEPDWRELFGGDEMFRPHDETE